MSRSDESHLLQMRGLKLEQATLGTLGTLSHLLQMRGLKLYQGNWDICIRRRIFYRCVD